MAEYDDFQANVEIVGEALVMLETPTGQEIEPTDPRVLSGLPSVAEAMKARFYYQPGLLAGVVGGGAADLGLGLGPRRARRAHPDGSGGKLLTLGGDMWLLYAQWRFRGNRPLRLRARRRVHAAEQPRYESLMAGFAVYAARTEEASLQSLGVLGG